MVNFTVSSLTILNYKAPTLETNNNIVLDIHSSINIVEQEQCYSTNIVHSN